jgi:hypothetical protein
VSARDLVPESLAANIDHLGIINRQIERLIVAKRDAIHAVRSAAERAADEPPEVAAAAYDYTLERVGCHHVTVLRAMGWSSIEHARTAGNRHGTTGPPPLDPYAFPKQGTPCVYALLVGKTVTYVGRSLYVKQRLKQHYKDGRRYDSAQWWACDSESEARDLEAVLQQQHRPAWNARIEARPRAAA